MTTKVCNKCGESKDVSSFSSAYNKKYPKKLKAQCKSCVRKQPNRIKRNERYQRERLEKTRGLRNRLYANGCEVCGEKEYCCLQIHHLNPDTKEREFSHLVNSCSIGTLERELEKGFSVLCSNCHLKVHAGVLFLPTKNFVAPYGDDE